MKKSFTLWHDESNPSVSLMEGKVTTTEFNKAHAAEGWRGDWIHKDNLRQEYWKLTGKKRGQMCKCEQDAKGAKLYTVMYW